MNKNLSIDEINALCAEIAEETMTQAAIEYCNQLDDEWIAMMEAQYPRYFGPDIDFDCTDKITH